MQAPDADLLLLQDEHQRGYLMFVLTSRWYVAAICLRRCFNKDLLLVCRFGFGLDMMSWFFVLVAVCAAMGAREQLNAGEVGLTLLYVSQLTSLFQWTVRQVRKKD